MPQADAILASWRLCETALAFFEPSFLCFFFFGGGGVDRTPRSQKEQLKRTSTMFGHIQIPGFILAPPG